jgi:hypothetical protein
MTSPRITKASGNVSGLQFKQHTLGNYSNGLGLFHNKLANTEGAQDHGA